MHERVMRKHDLVMVFLVPMENWSDFSDIGLAVRKTMTTGVGLARCEEEIV